LLLAAVGESLLCFRRDLFFSSSLPTANLSEALLDPDVDHKTAAGHALAITAMARMNDQRTVRKLVADSTA
jgi:hypothetical protein